VKICPFCAEEIQDAAIKCKHCKSSWSNPSGPASSAREAPDPQTAPPGRPLRRVGMCPACGTPADADARFCAGCGATVGDQEVDNQRPRAESSSDLSTSPQAMKRCPFCGEEVQDAAIKCRHCKSILSAPVAASTSTPVVMGSASSTGASASDDDVPAKFYERFALIDRAGGLAFPNRGQLSFMERSKAGLNFPAVVFGPFYYLYYGMWKKALSYSVFLTVLTSMLMWQFPALPISVVAAPMYMWGWMANRDLYKKYRLRQDTWW